MKHILISLAMLAGVSAPAMAATYTQAIFSGNVNNGNANAKPPFNTVGITQGMAFSGSFVVQDDLVPGPGLANIAFNSFADFASIPAADAFTLNIGSLSFTLADNIDTLNPALLQYNNGQLVGFIFNANVEVSGTWYLFSANGTGITVKKLDNIATAFNPHGTIVPATSSFVNAHFNAGATGGAPYTIPTVTPPAVPEPTTWALMIGGFAFAGAAMRRRTSVVAFA